MAME
jgi:ATP-dependent RNA/DNA helicase IGHMBP2